MVSAYACSMLSPVMDSMKNVSAATSDDCMEMAQAPSNGYHPSPLCQAHCEQTSQSHQTSVPDLPVSSLVALFEIPRLLVDSYGQARFIYQHLIPASTDGSPPLRIQYQVFRI